MGFIICLLFIHDVDLTGTGNDSQIICKERLASTDLSMVRPTLKTLGHLTVSMGSLTSLHRDYPSLGGFPGTIDAIYCLICKRIRGIGSDEPQPPLFWPAGFRRAGSNEDL